MEITGHDVYRIVFKEYPDVLNIKQVSSLMGVSTKAVYKLVRAELLPFFKVGREYRFTKVSLMQYMKVLETADHM